MCVQFSLSSQTNRNEYINTVFGPQPLDDDSANRQTWIFRCVSIHVILRRLEGHIDAYRHPLVKPIVRLSLSRRIGNWRWENNSKRCSHVKERQERTELFVAVHRTKANLQPWTILWGELTCGKRRHPINTSLNRRFVFWREHLLLATPNESCRSYIVHADDSESVKYVHRVQWIFFCLCWIYYNHIVYYQYLFRITLCVSILNIPKSCG